MSLCWILQPQFEQLYRQVQTVADGEAELSQMEKCTLNEGLILIRSVHLVRLFCALVIDLPCYRALYTVVHKKRATLFLTITPMFHGGFLHLLYQWKQE